MLRIDLFQEVSCAKLHAQPTSDQEHMPVPSKPTPSDQTVLPSEKEKGSDGVVDERLNGEPR